MSSRSPSATAATFAAISAYSSLLVIGLALLVLVGWWLDDPFLKGLHASLPTMKPNTTICFILLGGALWLLQARRENPRLRRLARSGAVLALLVALATLLEYGFSADWGIDQWLFHEAIPVPRDGPPGRMTPMSAVIFVLVAVAVFLMGGTDRRPIAAAQLLVLLAGIGSLLGVFGYAYGAMIFLGHSVAFTTMSLPSILANLLLCAGLLSLHPESGPMSIMVSRGAGGAIARRFLLATILVPVGTDLLFHACDRLGLLGPDSGTDDVLTAMTTVLAFALLVYFTARQLDRIDAERRQAEAALRTSEAKYRGLITQMQEGVVIVNREAQLVFANTRMAELLGTTPEAMLGQSVYAWIGAPAAAQAQQSFARILEGDNVRTEIDVRRQDGTAVPVLVSSTPLRNAEGQIDGALAVIVDVTARRQAQLERERQLAELRQALAESKTLRGHIPICSGCKKIRDEHKQWIQLEAYLTRHTDAKFSHGLCPSCVQIYFPEMADTVQPQDR